MPRGVPTRTLTHARTASILPAPFGRPPGGSPQGRERPVLARRSIVTLLAAVLSGALLAGCSGSNSASGKNGGNDADNGAKGAAPSAAAQPPSGASSAEASRPAVSSDPSSGCGKTPPRRDAGTLTTKNGRRTYLIALPPTYTGSEAAPLVLNFHGLGSNAIEQAAYSRLPAAGPEAGFIVVTPNHARGRTGWKLPQMANGQADIKFVNELLDDLEKKLCVDRNREFATGMSNGAGLSSALVCGLDGRLAAVAPVAGVNLAFPCDDAEPTTVIAFHGTADEIVPYAGGPPFGGQLSRVPTWMRPKTGKINLPGVEWIVGRWARTFGCGPATDGVGGGEVRLRRYSGCRGGAVVELHTVRDGGHTWPGSLQVGSLGKTTTLIDATTLTLEAFADHPATD
jgi:polyhydroxybutyrate depolymerase